jgi:hypothetical protein
VPLSLDNILKNIEQIVVGKNVADDTKSHFIDKVLGLVEHALHLDSKS